MTPAEIYALPSEHVTSDITSLLRCSWHHMYELGQELGWRYAEFESTERLEIRTVKYYCYDGRRTWVLRTVWLDEKPVMIVQNAGRESDDHVARYITDETLFRELVAYVRSRIVPEDPFPVNTIDLHEDMAELTYFYGQALEGPFEPYEPYR